MTFQQEFKSWFAPSGGPELAQPPTIGSKAPSTVDLPFPRSDGKPAFITFLRHCGCPFAEKSFLTMRESAKSHPDLDFIAISHSNHESTDKWVKDVGGAGNVAVIVDAERKIYSAWGLGVSSWGHVLSPTGLMSVYKTGKEEGIWNRPTESGSRWQRSGSWAVDSNGNVRWGGPAESAADIPDINAAVSAM